MKKKKTCSGQIWEEIRLNLSRENWKKLYLILLETHTQKWESADLEFDEKVEESCQNKKNKLIYKQRIDNEDYLDISVSPFLLLNLLFFSSGNICLLYNNKIRILSEVILDK